MQNKFDSFFKKYKSIRTEIDLTIKKLESEHKKHLNCKSGCDMCCMDYSILPVEFYFVLNALKKQKNKISSVKSKDNNSCVFLKNHVCTIYEQRPVICRTHGLPLVFMNENDEWELSACELNFTEFNFENFTLDNTFQQDKFNSKLFVLNKEFIRTFSEKQYEEFELIPIKNLLKHL